MRISDWSSDVCSSDLIEFRGVERRTMRPHVAARQGIARTFQNVALFKGMSTLDNIMTGRVLKMKSNLFQQAIYWGANRREEIAHRQTVEKIIDFLEIQAIRRTRSEEHTSELQSLMRISYAVFCLKKKNTTKQNKNTKIMTT